MGAGIAQLGCLGGYLTYLFDPDVGALASGADRLEAALAKGAGKGLWGAGDAAAAADRLRRSTRLDELAECSLVIEAAPERLDSKRAIFAELEGLCAPEAVLATNTSSLPVGDIAAALERPERVCGMHFFNPPALMRLVEVVAGPGSAESTLELCERVAEAMGRTAVRATDTPGFIVNRCNRPYALESLRMLSDGVASHVEIDRAMRELGGYRMGPFELIDLIGVDVNLAVARSFYEQRPVARWKPLPLQERMVAEGLYGRKSGEGFYRYTDGRKVEPEATSTGADPDAIVHQVVAQLVNEASFAAQESVAAPADIDIAMRLGLNHPKGPFEWRDELGAAALVALLDELAGPDGDERYAVAGSLRSAAAR